MSSHFSPQEVTAFWEAVTPHWNRRPTLVKKPFKTPFIDQHEFLALLKKWGDDVRAGRKAIEVAKLDAGAAPSAEHQTLADCERHIGERWQKDWYLYVPDGVQVYNGVFWERAVEIIRPAIKTEGGLPSGGLMLEMFFGRYQATPTGIHLDSSDNLAFIARGPKRMLFWPRGRFDVKYASPPNDPSLQCALTGRWADHLSDAIVIDADEGDIIYWPKDYWHIGASDGGWSGMVTLPMWWSARPSSLAKSVLSRLLDLQGDAPGLYAVDEGDLPAAAATVPATLQNVIDQVKTQVNTRLELTAHVAWAKFVTAYGFITPPSPRPAPAITESSRVHVTHPIVSVPLGRACAVVACGHSMLVHDTSVASIVEKLEVGSEHALGDLAPFEKLMGDLASARALEVLPRPSPG